MMATRKPASTVVENVDVSPMFADESEAAFFEQNKRKPGRVAKPSVHADLYGEVKAAGAVGKVPSTQGQLEFNKKELQKAALHAGDGRPEFVYNDAASVLLFKPTAKRKRVRRS
jgi:hypothetical protein